MDPTERTDGGTDGEQERHQSGLAEVDRPPVMRVDPTAATAAAGDRVWFRFTTGGDEGITYGVLCDDPAMSSWCRVIPPTEPARSGEVVVDVPDDARPGSYRLRIVATGSGGAATASEVMLRVERERCLKVVAAPQLDLQPDGSVLVTLRVVNCGPVDMNLVLKARHEGGWSFTVDAPELVIAAGDGLVTVKVTLRAPTGSEVEPGDRITVEVETGDGWQALPARVPRRRGPWGKAMAAAVVAGTALVALVLAFQGSGGGSGGSFAGGGGSGRPPVASGDDGETTGRSGDSGDGGPGGIAVEPFFVDFGEVAVGDSAERTVSVVNVDDRSVDVSVTVDGDEAFTVDDSGCGLVAVDDRCELLVRFAPEVEGTVEADVAVGEAMLEVTGAGVADAGVASVEPPSILSLTVVSPAHCQFTVTWDVTEGAAGELELLGNGRSLGLLPVTDGDGTFFGDVDDCPPPTFTLVAFDAEGNEVDRESATVD